MLFYGGDMCDLILHPVTNMYCLLGRRVALLLTYVFYGNGSLSIFDESLI